MKFNRLPRAEVRDTDTASMRDDIEFLRGHGIDVRRPEKSKTQLKLDEITSYYLGKGTLFVDEDTQPWPEKGRDALRKWLANRDSLNICPP